MKKCLVVDISNLFWRLVAAQKSMSADNSTTAALALHGCLLSLKKYYRIVQPDEIAVAFEGSNNWRKEYTSSKDCVSKRLYKGNRVFDPDMEVLLEVFKSFKQMVQEYTSVLCLSHPRLEGDDCIAAYADVKAGQGCEVVILSGDKDFASLITDNIKLLDPNTGAFRQLEDLCGVNNPEYFLFEKCFRGDAGDNVMTAYPKVRKTKIQKAFEDPFHQVNIMNETWTIKDADGNEIVHRVGDLFNENKMLMGLRSQPLEIREIMKDMIVGAYENQGDFNFIRFVRFLNDMNLPQIVKQAEEFAKMFSLKQKKKEQSKQQNGFSF